MKIRIDFDKKEILVLGKVNAQDLFMKLGDLSIDLSEYTLTAKDVISLSPAIFPSFPDTYPGINNPYCGTLGNNSNFK